MASAIIVVGGLEASRFATMTTDTMKKVADIPVVVKIGSIGLSNARQVLLNVANPADSGRKTAGVCRLFSTPMRSGGVGRIHIDLFSVEDDTLGPDWERAFPSGQWETFSSSYCQPNGYKRCLRPTSNVEGLSLKEIARLQPEIFIELVPVLVRKSVGEEQSAIRLPATSGETIKEDASDVAFLVFTTTRYTAKKKDNIRVDKVARMAVWAGEAECMYEFTLGGTTETILLNPSAIGSGVTDETLFSASEGTFFERLLRVRFPTSVRVESQIAEVDGRRLGISIRTNESMASIACNENRYRCPSRSTGREWAPSMGGGAVRLIFNRMNPHHLTSSVDVIPRYTFRNGGGEVTPAPNVTYSTIAGPFAERTTIISNWRTILTEVSNALQVCSEICSESGSAPYNWADDGSGGVDETNSEIYFAHIHNTMPDVQVDGSTHFEEDTDPKPVGCSCCFMKQCGMRGVNVFGYCHKQPLEPLDSRVPECEGTNDAIVRRRQLANNATSGSGRCIAARLNSNGSLTFIRRACSDSLRSLCYFQGTYRLAQDGITQNYIRSNFDGAFQSCYQMGGERLNRVGVDTLLTGQGNFNPANMPPVVGSNYEFVNGGAAGYFIAPQDLANVRMVARGIRDVLWPASEQFWVNMRVDSAGFRYAAPPNIPATTSEFSTESDRDGILNFNRDSVHPFTTTSASAMMLMNTRRYFGALNVGPTQAAAPQRVICFNPNNNDVELSATTMTQFTGARSICRDANAVFIPPVTPSQWTSAMVRAEPMSPTRPWPLPTVDRLGAWVAYERVGGQWRSNALIEMTKFDPTSKSFFADSREVYFVGPYGDALADVQLPMTSSTISPSASEPTHILCRTGNPKLLNFRQSLNQISIRFHC